MDTAPLGVFDRRRFLRRVVGRGGTLELSCERLYIRYLEAASAGRLPDFLSALRAKLRDADDVVLAEPEWLAREDFRLALEGALEVRLQGARRPSGWVSNHPTPSELRAPR